MALEPMKVSSECLQEGKYSFETFFHGSKRVNKNDLPEADRSLTVYFRSSNDSIT